MSVAAPPWSRASAPVWALVSGYSSRIRAGKLLAFLQAFSDDSASDAGKQRLFMAGYLNRADRWALFADAWDEELRAAPSISYLKMVEANNLRGEFRGWSEEDKDEKLRGLARVIRHFTPFSFQFSLDRQPFNQAIKPIAPRGLGNPHFLCVFGIASSVARCAHREGVKDPIKFIFDTQQGVSEDIQLLFADMLSDLPRGARKLISGLPQFEDDKDLLPLQAADMLAWHIRREHEICGPNERLPMADVLRYSDGHLVTHLDESHFPHWAERFSEMPGVVGRMQGKAQWRAVKREVVQLHEQGFRYPFGSRWRNALYRTRQWLTRASRRFLGE